MEFRKTNKGYILRLGKGEKIVEELTTFCKEQEIRSGIFHGIGAAKEITLSFYHLDSKSYEDKHLTTSMEIVGLTGNVALVDGEQYVHIHGVFSDQELRCFGGHLKEGVVGPTCEIYLTDFETTIERKYDEETGLKLLSCSLPSQGSFS